MTPTSSQEVSVLLPLVIALLATLATIVIHAVALAAIAYYVRRERQLGRAGHADKSRHAALKRTIGPALRVGGRDKEISRALDEGFVVGAERRARQFFFQSVCDTPAVETVLQLAVSVVIHGAHGTTSRH